MSGGRLQNMTQLNAVHKELLYSKIGILTVWMKRKMEKDVAQKQKIDQKNKERWITLISKGTYQSEENR